MAEVRTYSAGKFLLTIDGVDAGFLYSLEGGDAFGDVVEAPLVTGVIDKRIAAVHYEPITFEVTVPLAKPLYDWFSAFLNRSQQRTSGAVVLLDYDMKERSRLEWDDALITELAFPALDASSKEIGRLRCVIQPSRTRRVPGSGSRSDAKAPAQKQSWHVSNFALSLPGLETSAQHVSRIEPLVIRQAATTSLGEREELLEPGLLQIPPLVLTVSAGSAEPLFAWFDDFVIQGRNAEKDERSGSLQLRSDNQGVTLLGLSMTNLGIYRVGELRAVSDSQSIRKVRAELYCEQMELTPASAPAAPPPPAVAPAPADVTPALAGLTETVAGIFRQALAEAARQPGIAAAAAPAQGYRADAIAQRLLATAAAARVEPLEAQEARRALGIKLGTEWAATTATLAELERLSKLAATDWSAIVLREDDSLIRFLVKRGELAEGETGPLDLVRDAFTEGLVAGAADIRSKAAEHLDDARLLSSSPHVRSQQ